MKIITISREFGSGGRELGKRMADLLGYDYYDKEIILDIAEKQKLDEQYVEHAIDQAGQTFRSYTVRRSIANISYYQTVSVKLLAEQTRVLREIAQRGRDCVIIGRNADLILEEEQPFRLFVYADPDAKLQRCRERASGEEHLRDRELLRKMKQIDSDRKKTRAMLSGDTWGQKDLYELMVNTTDWNIKELAPLISSYAENWFGREQYGNSSV
ncbi:MAG: cytidylate kinase-like family protein [Lachnospiraceae bacterium]|nr:cytidylate kinase-like family protein [Lachnospiraceae bacterium]